MTDEIGKRMVFDVTCLTEFPEIFIEKIYTMYMAISR